MLSPDAQASAAAPFRCVTPRVLRAGSDVSLSLHALIAPLLDHKTRAIICLTGPAGSGKTTALRFLESRFATEVAAGQLVLSDEADLPPAAIALVITTFPAPRAIETLTLASWTLDDCTEYLALFHRDSCPAILSRLKLDDTLGDLDGCPQLLASAMDAFAANPDLRSALVYLGEQLWSLVPAEHRPELVAWCAPGGDAAKSLHGLPVLETRGAPAQLLGRGPLQRYIVARWLVDVAETTGFLAKLMLASVWNVRSEVMLIAATRPTLLAQLEAAVSATPAAHFIPLAATILLASDRAWRPTTSKDLNLSGASLSDAIWPGIDLTSVNLRGADLSRADLRSAILVSATLTNATLSGADLSAASMCRAGLHSADLSNASLISADLTGVNLHAARLDSANFAAANFRNAQLEQVSVEDAIFSSADFSSASLARVKMYLADWTGARFPGAILNRCNLENLVLPDADFTGANLGGSYLTASQIPRGKFSGANLANTGLADIDWPGADLSGADLTNAAFHLGSSRSGLVGSLTPSEGSRTGFYTDDSKEQHYKRPEEIRKANLTSANLAGAKIERSDFYLVDLRHAKYTPDQKKHLLATGAILEYPYP